MSETIRINNTNLTYARIWYVDAVNGSDSSGNGTSARPFKTFSHLMNNYSSQFANTHAIYFAPGLYEYYHANTSPRIPDMIGESPLNTHIKTAASNDWAQALRMFLNAKVMRLHLEINPDYQNDTAYLISTTEDGNTSAWDPKNYGPVSIYNCLFTGSTKGYRTSSWIDANIQNCFYTYTPTVVYGILTLKNCVYVNASDSYNLNTNSISYDANYNITSGNWLNAGDPSILNPDGSRSHIGLYGGPYSIAQFFPNYEWERLNNYLDAPVYQINNTDGIITDNFQFTTYNGEVIPHEVIDFEKGKIRIKIPFLKQGDNKIYFKFTDTQQQHELILPEGKEEIEVPLNALKKTYQRKYRRI